MDYTSMECDGGTQRDEYDEELSDFDNGQPAAYEDLDRYDGEESEEDFEVDLEEDSEEESEEEEY